MLQVAQTWAATFIPLVNDKVAMTRQENGNYPTISGVGSEVGRTAVIADTEQRIERISFHPRFLPAKVIADLTLMLDSPPHPEMFTRRKIDYLPHYPPPCKQ